MKKAFLVLFSYFLFLSAFAQQQPTVDLLPVNTKSPDAAILGRFGNIPVGYSTGIPNISIPIYEIKVGKIDLPISLDYHAGGVKVNDIPSSIGIGWALNAGGIISRNMVGLPDDQANGYLGTPKESDLYLDYGNYSNYFYQIPGSSDTDPDLFFYTVGSQSGKFVFNKDRSVFQIPKTDYKIQYSDPTQTAESSFRVTDPNGIVYIFDTYETTQVGVIIPAYPSSWRLTKIIDQNQRDTVFLNYEYLAGGNEYLRDDQASFINTPVCYECASNDIGCNARYTPFVKTNTLYQIVNTPVVHNEMNLKEIVWRGGKIEFTNIKDRLDRTGERRVNEVDIYSNFNGNLKLLKRAKLFHSYFYYNSTLTQTYPYANSDSRNYRLKLDSVGFFPSNVSQPPNYYRMTYNTTNMASRESTGQDMFGYNNGKFNNQSLIPEQIVNDDQNIYYTIGNGNSRSTDSLYMQACSLQSLEYPTGGKTVYVLEPHRYQDPTTYTTQGTTCGTLSGSGPSSNTITFTPSGYLKLRYVISFSTYDYNYQIQQPSVTIDDQTTGGQKIFYSPDNRKYWSSGTNYSGQSGTIYDFIDGHTYKITTNVYTNTNGSQPVLVNMQLSWESNIGNPAYVIGGGLRVKDITNYDNNGGFINKDSYMYENNMGEGYGQLMTAPWLLKINYQSFSNKIGCSSSSGGCYAMIAPLSYIYHSNSMVSISEIMGSPVLYNSVTKYQTSATSTYSNGKTVYTYNIIQDMPFFASSFSPVDIMCSNEWQNNYLAGEKTYKSVGLASWQIVSDKEYTYSTDRQENKQALKIQPKYNFLGGCRVVNAASIPSDFALAQYPIPTGVVTLHNITTTDYNSLGGSTTSTENRFYDDTTHLLPTRIQTFSSKNDTYTTIMKYAHDFDTTGNVYNTMLNRNIKVPVVQVQKMKNIIQESLLKADYSDLYGNGSLLVPVRVNQQILTNPIETKVKFDKYDVYGNIIQQHNVNAPSTSYLWGYNGQYPVAEVKNAKVNEVYLANEEEGTDFPDWGVSRDAIVVHSGKYSGRVDNSGSGEFTVHSNTWLQVQNASAKSYHYSGWVYSTGPGIDLFLFMKRAGEGGYFSYVDAVSTSATGQWVWLEKDFLVPADVTQLNLRVDNNGSTNGQVQSVWFDDLRIRPSDAQMTSYTYDPLVGMTSSTDSKGMTTTYEYDSFQRLLNIKDKDGNIIKHNDYHYQGQ